MCSVPYTEEEDEEKTENITNFVSLLSKITTTTTTRVVIEKKWRIVARQVASKQSRKRGKENKINLFRRL